MKTIALAGFALGLMSIQAAAQTVEFRGGFCITNVTAQCAADGVEVGDCLLLRYSPPNLGTNGVKTEFTVLSQTFGDNYSLASGSLLGNTFKAVDLTHAGRTGSKSTSTMRITSQAPTLSATSPNVRLSGNITDYAGTAGCTVAFSAAAAKRP